MELRGLVLAIRQCEVQATAYDLGHLNALVVGLLLKRDFLVKPDHCGYLNEVLLTSIEPFIHIALLGN